MHDSAHRHGQLFFELYWHSSFKTIVDLGSFNVNGSLRDHCPDGAEYVGLDMNAGPGVDLVINSGEAIPLPDAYADVVVTTSVFEHDSCFWVTFLDLIRILKPGGLLYINAPSNLAIHRYPLDCWRFYPDAGMALIDWATRSGLATQLVESMLAEPGDEGWADFIAVFRKLSSSPLVRKGRIADHTRSHNVRDGSSGKDIILENSRNESSEMILIEGLKNRLSATESKLSDLVMQREEFIKIRSAYFETKTALEKATGESKQYFAQLEAIKSSKSWRMTAPFRKFLWWIRGR